MSSRMAKNVYVVLHGGAGHSIPVLMASEMEQNRYTLDSSAIATKVAGPSHLRGTSF
jgi:hypothetical protein